MASSSPEVSEADINSLLLFGDLADEVGISAVLSALVGEGVGAGLAGLIPVDRLEVDTISSELSGELALRIRAVKRFLEEQLEVTGFATVGQEVDFGVSSELAVPGWPRLLVSWERATDSGFGGLLPVEIGALAVDLKAVFEAD